MPYTRKRKRTNLKSRRGPFKRRRTFYRAVRRKPRVPGTREVMNIFPDKKVVKMPYHERVTISATSGVPGSYTFAANGLYDPNLTGAGHQPMTFDQFASFYKYYTVIGAKISAWFTPVTATSEPLCCGIFLDPNNDGLPGTSLTHILEASGTKYRFGSLSDGRHVMKVNSNFSAKRDMSTTDPLDEPTLGAGFTANPSKLAIFRLFMGPLDESSTVSSVQINVRITYIVVLTRSVDPGLS